MSLSNVKQKVSLGVFFSFERFLVADLFIDSRSIRHEIPFMYDQFRKQRPQVIFIYFHP